MGDFDGDAATDLVVPSFNGNFVSVLLNTTTQAPPDTTPPAISGVSASGITSSGATISWTTNETSDSQVEYGTTTAYGSSTALNSSRVTSHSQALNGLSAGALYHYRVKSRDAAGNLALSGDNTFTTTVQTFTLTVTIENLVSLLGIGSGSVTSSPAGIDCGSTCSATYNSGTVVTLTAHPGHPMTGVPWRHAPPYCCRSMRRPTHS
jgi:hypothetical protein